MTDRMITGDPYRNRDQLEELLPVPECTVTETVQPEDAILLIRLGGIGDALRILPVAAYLRNNGFQGDLHCAVEPPVGDVIRSTSYFDRVHSIPLYRWLSDPVQLFHRIDQLREVRFVWSFDCHGILKSGVLARLVSAQVRAGYHRNDSKEANPFFQDVTISKLNERLPRILKYLQLLRPFTSEYRVTRSLLQPSFSSFNPVRSEIRELGEREPVLVHPTTSAGRYGARKDWGLDQFQSLVERLLDHSSRPIRITWGPGEEAAAERLAGAFDDRVRPTPPTSELTEFAYLIREARFLVTVDSSPAHFADLLGTPTVVIYGVGKTWINAPFFSTYRMASAGEGERTTDIPVDRVWRACEQLMETI